MFALISTLLRTCSAVPTARRRRAAVPLLAGIILIGALVAMGDVSGQSPAPAATQTAAAAATDTDPDEPGLGCLAQVNGSLTPSVSSVVMHAPATLTWRTTLPGGCYPTIMVSGFGPVARNDSGVVYPIGTVGAESATYTMSAYLGGKTKPLASATIGVRLPDPFRGRRTVEIKNNSEVNWFIRAIKTPNTTVLLNPDLNLNLTGRGTLEIYPGVHVIGGRTPTRPGARLFVTRSGVAGTHIVLSIGEYLTADGVRIDGIRLDGGNNGSIEGANDPTWIGIKVYSSVNVEIANSEISGWSIAIQVSENSGEHETDRLSLDNASAVWIHDNYIHNQRHWREQGYGVDVDEGAWALIERNAFDNNRHAIAGDGSGETGYLAYHNYLGPHGGENCCEQFSDLFPIQHTHQFDEHGTESCDFRELYCGRAGQYFDMRYNTLTYTAGDVIKIRGIPDAGADVMNNVFAKEEGESALSQTRGDNIRRWGNQFSTDGTVAWASCDFDRDGVPNVFHATGAAWWFKGATGPRFLNTSSLAVPDLEFRDVDGDGRCDVRVPSDGRVFSGGRGKLLVDGKDVHAWRTDLVWSTPGTSGEGSVQVWHMRDSTLQSVPSQATVTARLGLTGTTISAAVMIGSGDFNADGASDILWRERVTASSAEVYVTLLDADGNVVNPAGHPSNSVPGVRALGTIAIGTTMAGIGDFNADGRADILWRHENGQPEIWFAGSQGNAALVTYNNRTDTHGRPRVQEPVPSVWKVRAVADFNGDGYSDILWQADGAISIWHMVHAMHVGDLTTEVAAGYEIAGVGDFDGDRRDDILWRGAAGGLTIWFSGSPERQGHPHWKNYSWFTVGPDWKIQHVGDFNADGQADIVWRHDSGVVVIWTMAGAFYIGESAHLPMDTSWELRGLLKHAPERINMQ